jgi:N-methylhydantoinase A
VAIERPWIETGDVAAIRGAFDRRHQEIYDYFDPNSAVGIVNLRLVIVGELSKPELPALDAATGPPAPLRRVSCVMRGVAVEADLYERSALKAGHRFAGPAIIVQEDTTTIVPPHARVAVDRLGNAFVELQ